MTNRERKQIRKRVISASGHRSLRRSARRASLNAQRASRVLDIPYAEADKLAKMIPNEVHITIKKALEQNRELQELYENDEETKKILDIAMRLEGLPRQASTHACRSANYR